MSGGGCSVLDSILPAMSGGVSWKASFLQCLVECLGKARGRESGRERAREREGGRGGRERGKERERGRVGERERESSRLERDRPEREREKREGGVGTRPGETKLGLPEQEIVAETSLLKLSGGIGRDEGAPERGRERRPRWWGGAREIGSGGQGGARENGRGREMRLSLAMALFSGRNPEMASHRQFEFMGLGFTCTLTLVTNPVHRFRIFRVATSNARDSSCSVRSTA
ncbi:hypothetical protein ACLOJK_001974 [Asimina triloba]